jgi:hypothetical protein
MLRVTTLYAASAAATAAYYTQYLTAAPGEVPGVWAGRQAAGLGLSGEVDATSLQTLLEGRDPHSGTPLGRSLIDLPDARVRAVAGFDATFSAPKSVSVLWALTQDSRLLDAHDVAVRAALAHLERFGSTTRIRAAGGRLHPDTGGLSMAVFRQTTSRADDPQLHTHRVGVDWQPIVNGQAEIAGVPADLLAVFSKRTEQVDQAAARMVVDFRAREGRDPTRWERAALTRQAAVDTRNHKTGTGVADLRPARDRQLDAYSRQRSSGRLGARAARRDVAAADQEYETALARRRDAQSIARPAQEASHQAHASIRGIETSLSGTRILNGWSRSSARVNDLGRLANALDHWEHWARGHAVEPTTLVHVVHTLELHSRRRGGCRQLAQVVDLPASNHQDRRGPPQPALPHRDIGMGIEP